MVASSASAASTGTTTFFSTYDAGSGAQKVSFVPSSAKANSAVKFVPSFIPDRRFSDAGVGDPNTPSTHQWAITASREPRLNVIRNRATNECLDIEQERENITQTTDAVGARVTVRPCDGTMSQNWKVSIATGNQHTFRNAWTDLIFTKTGNDATLELFERRGRVQTFSQTRVGQVFS
jgi:hypothetical protein